MNAMKNKMVGTLAIAACLFAGVAAQASGTSGDIYEIRPCTYEGVAREAWATKSSPLDSGETVYFNIRLIQGARQDTNTVWFLSNNSLGSSSLNEYIFPLQVGIYVSGKLAYASLVNWKADKDSGFTDLIFEYTTKPGDFALPVVLATETGPAMSSDGSNKYRFNRYGSSQWRIVNLNGEEFNPWFWNPPGWPVSAPETERVQDFSLVGAGIYVKTADFDSKWESGSAATYEEDGTGLWRSVHQGSVETKGATPTIQLSAASTNSVTLYVWSTDESAVRISGGTKKTITTGYSAGGAVTTNAYVGTVTIAGGRTSQDFYIQGVSTNGGANADGKATLVLSAWSDYSYNNTNDRIDDYIEVPVQCIEPLPPTVTVVSESGAETVYVPIGNGWKTKVETLNVYVTQPVEEDLTVTVTPSVAGRDDLDMSQYVMFSTAGSTVKTITQLSATATVTLEAGASGLESAKKVYVYLFRADEETDGGTVDFYPSIPDEQAASTGIANFIPEAFEIVATAPAIVSPADGSEFGGTAGVEQPVEIEVSDTYADSKYTAEDGDGYVIEVKYSDSSAWTTLSGTYYTDAKGVLKDANGKLPVLKFPTSSINTASGTFNTQIRITEPVNGNQTTVKLVATVAAPKTVAVATDKDTYAEGAQAEFTVTLNSANDTGEALYAFILAGPGDEATAGRFNALGRKFVVTEDILGDPAKLALTSGLVINPDNVSATGKVKLLDGADLDTTGGSTYYFSVVLCTTSYYSEDAVVSGYNSNFQTITVYNETPVIKRLEMNNYPSESSGYLFPNRLPKGNTQKFKAVVTDAGSYDLTDGFQTRWTCYRNGLATYTETIDGNPGTELFEYAFPNAGNWTVKAEVKDKDMEDWSETSYSVGVTVLDNPIAGVTVADTLDENTTTEKVTVQLSYWDEQFTGELLVKVTVSEYSAGRSNPGKFKLDSNYASTVDGEENVYYVTVNSANGYDLVIEEMDGTDVSSIYGFSVKAEVVSDAVLPTSNTPANEYYLPESKRVLVNNVSPTVIVNPEPNTNRWEVAGGVATQYPIRWKVQRDVDADFTDEWAGSTNKGVRVEFTGCSNEGATYWTEPASGVFYPDFGEMQGDATVTLTIEDKDGGFYSYTYLYTISASKFLNTKSAGPNGGTTTSAISKKYAALENRGQGHAYVQKENGTVFSSAANFISRWNCGKNTEARIYAFGYKVAKPVDDGTLDGGLDVAIGPSGSASSGETLTSWYTYPDKTKDSFFYCWIQHLASEDGGLTSSILGGTILPESPAAGAADGKVLLPTEKTEDGGYLTTEVEAVFAKEWLASDNLGDINNDGVPDVFAMYDWQGGNLIELVTGGDRLENDTLALNAENPDGDKLPGVFAAGEEALKVDPATSRTYAPIGLDLDTRTEIRGLHEGLNAIDQTVSDIYFSAVEEAAWQKYVEDQNADNITFDDEGNAVTNMEGWVDADVRDLAVWSPEPRGKFARMDPTVEDTDGDGFPDGWEYFFWYQAHVWAPSGDKLGQPISTKYARQNFAFERFTFDNVVSGDEIPRAEVEARFNPCDPLDKAAYAENPDFDNDGLSDLEELVIGTNPCHWDSDGDRMCDAWEVMMGLDPLTAQDSNGKDANEDGDYMAYHSTSADLSFAKDAETGRVYVLPGLEAFVDYDPLSMRILKSGRYDYWSFVPKTVAKTVTNDDGEEETVEEPVVYGDPSDVSLPGQNGWAWGRQMVDSVERGVTNLDASATLSAAGSYVLVHNQVMDAFGFDPRTAWSASSHGYVSARWDPAVNKNVQKGDKTGLAVNTKAYSAYDEYLVMKYRRDYQIKYDGSRMEGEAWFDPDDVWGTIQSKTTVPTILTAPLAASSSTNSADTASSGTNSTDTVSSDDSSSSASSTGTSSYNVSCQIAAALQQCGSTKNVAAVHGADTDGDGVPDGWELYTFRNPNYIITGTGSSYEDGLGDGGARDFDGDTLSYVNEYAGTDSCEAYGGCETIMANHPGTKSGWYNKFFPTNPGTRMDRGRDYSAFGNDDGEDTDLDGVPDNFEGSAWTGTFFQDGTFAGSGKMGFIYGNVSNSVNTLCFRGGGMNPCTIDTDGDGLPDGWEAQFAGVPVDTDTGKVVPVRDATRAVVTNLSYTTTIADAAMDAEFSGGEDSSGEDEQSTEEESSSFHYYIAGGMDATYSGDATSMANVRDVDFDHDGLENYQEYLVQSLRHLRYDDISTPLMGRQLEEGDGGYPHQQNFWGYVAFNPADPEAFAADCAEAWYGKDAVYYVTVTTGVQRTIELVNVQTGEMRTNFTYRTERRKKYFTYAEEVVKHATSEGAYQYAWNDDGWRKLGYFAAPRRKWDRAIASGAKEHPVYMFPVTGKMDFEGVTPIGYIGTDPRSPDTDGDGMDDGWEIFHGLNPILGTNVDEPSESTLNGSRRGDIISATYGKTDSFNGFWNEWIRPDYNRALVKHGQSPDASGPIVAPQAFDPVLYPWIMGSPGADADSDGMRNEDERITANLADPQMRHTDPSPLWFTERTTPCSYTAQYYPTADYVRQMGWTSVALVEKNDGFQDVALKISDGSGYMFSFEEAEGYDTDGDVKPDSREVTSTVTGATDPIKFADPARRQAIYFDGVDSFAMSRDPLVRPTQCPDLFKQFTVECWLRPDALGTEQTVVERSTLYGGDSTLNDAVAVRANFRIGLKADGRLYGMFDNTDAIESGLNAPVSCQIVYDETPLDEGEWVHAALTYDGSDLRLYRNGRLVAADTSGLVPANGISRIVQDPGATNTFPVYSYTVRPVALFIGARPKAKSKYALYASYVTSSGEHKESYDNYREFFKGYVDEVRIWDGARSVVDIASDYRREYSFDDVAAQRQTVFDSWLTGDTRNANDGNGNLPPELVHHYNFDTLAGATEPGYVSKTPPGFAAKVLAAASSDYASNPDISADGLYPNILSLKGGDDGSVEGDFLVGWWNDCVLRSKVYDDYHVVPWIHNTLAHLPAIDGTCLDSKLYSDSYGSSYSHAQRLGLSSYVFQNSANPYTSAFRGYEPYLRYRVACRIAHALDDRYQRQLARYDMRSSFMSASDLLPLGGAFAKSCPEMWYGAPSDAWEFTGSDDDADGLPDWWEEYARNNYCEHLDPSAELNWDTVVYRNGVAMTAGVAYMLDIYNGMSPDFEYDSQYASTYDANGNYIPDWWEKLYKVENSDGFADTDGDGLSDYAEYLMSEVFDLGQKFDPRNPISANGKDLDCFFKIGELYAGEIFCDHDMVEDAMEDLWQPAYSSRYVYDAHKDADGDGWSVFAEARHLFFTSRILAPEYSHYNADEEMPDMPTPVLKLALKYNGDQKIDVYTDNNEAKVDEPGQEGDNDHNQVNNQLGNLIIETFTKDGVVVPDARYIIKPGLPVGREFYIGGWSERTVRGYLAPGYVQVSDLTLSALEVSEGVTYNWYVWPEYETSHNDYSHWWGDSRYGYKSGTFRDYLRDVYNYGAKNVELIGSSPAWSVVTGFSVVASVDTVWCKLMYDGTQVGKVNATTGEFEMDLGKIGGVRTSESTDVDLDLETVVLRLNYKSQVPTLGHETVKLYLGQPNIGHVKEGKNTIVAYYDLNDGDYAYTTGEPLGCLSGVDVGWYGRDFEIELTDTSPVITRANLLTGESTDASDRRTLYGLEDGDFTNIIAGVLSSDAYQRIRIVRTHVNGTPVQSLGINGRVILDKMMHLGQRSFFYEGDILENGELDLDWSYLYDDVVSRYSDPTEVAYSIILGNGSVDLNATNNLYAIATVRHFDSASARTRPVAISPGRTDSIVYDDFPVFKWTMNKMNSYTAFRLQILEADGGTVVWDSGIRRAPATDLEGVYTFKADAYTGDELEKDVQYTWRVSMYNAKFQNPLWSNENPYFYMHTHEAAVNYGSIPVALRYFGPSAVANASTFVVEAFDTPDFTGTPVSRAAVTAANRESVVTPGTDRETNITLIGLPAGTYYVRAYADSNAYGVKRSRDSWESWGYACPRSESLAMPYNPRAVKITGANIALAPVEIYIEDVDTNQNAVPDAYEVETNGGSLDNGAEKAMAGVPGNTMVYDAIVDGISGKVVSAAGVAPSYDPYLSVAFSSPTLTALALGIDPKSMTVNGDGSITVESEVEDVAIASVGFDENGKLVVSVEGTLSGATADGYGLLDVKAQTEKTVVCNVYRKTSLAQADWDLIATETITVGAEAQDVAIDGVEQTASGFFKVTVTE